MHSGIDQSNKCPLLKNAFFGTINKGITYKCSKFFDKRFFIYVAEFNNVKQLINKSLFKHRK